MLIFVRCSNSVNQKESHKSVIMDTIVCLAQKGYVLETMWPSCEIKCGTMPEWFSYTKSPDQLKFVISERTNLRRNSYAKYYRHNRS